MRPLFHHRVRLHIRLSFCIVSSTPGRVAACQILQRHLELRSRFILGQQRLRNFPSLYLSGGCFGYLFQNPNLKTGVSIVLVKDWQFKLTLLGFLNLAVLLAT